MLTGGNEPGIIVSLVYHKASAFRKQKCFHSMAFLTKSLAKDVFRGQQLANSKPDLSHDYTGSAPITAAHSNQEVN